MGHRWMWRSGVRSMRQSSSAREVTLRWAYTPRSLAQVMFEAGVHDLRQEPAHVSALTCFKFRFLRRPLLDVVL